MASERPRPPRSRPPVFLDDFMRGGEGSNEDGSPPSSTDNQHASSADAYRAGPASRHPPPSSFGPTPTPPPKHESPRSSYSEAPPPRSSSWVGGGPGDGASSYFPPPPMPWMRSESSSYHSPGSSRPASPPLLGGHRASSAGPLPYYPPSASSHATFYGGPPRAPKKTFHSNLLTGPVDKPWLRQRDVWATLSWWAVVACFVAGLGASGAVIFFNYRSVPSVGKVCLVFEDDFTGTSIDGSKWQHEVEAGGFGNGEFSWTTTQATNSFVEDGLLYIVPTLTSDAIGVPAVWNGYAQTIAGCTSGSDGAGYFSNKVTGAAAGLRKREAAPPASQSQSQSGTGSGTASGTGTTSGTATKSSTGAASAATGGGGANGVTGGGTGTAGQAGTNPCSVVSNAADQQVVTPVQSARLTTRLSANVSYGRVEVRAKLPTGDWMWPSIWMLPTNLNGAYGKWPLSGEIDIMQGRGNSPNYAAQGTDFVTSGLNWGPSIALNAFEKTRGWLQNKHSPYNTGFHTFTLEWSKDFLWVYVDVRTKRVLDLRFNKETFFQRGKFPQTFINATGEQIVTNPWANSKDNSAPFDQSFYLVLDVAVGGTNGWFEDNVGGKPWLDRSPTAMYDFAKANATWYKTWPTQPKARGMAVDYVRMYKQC